MSAPTTLPMALLPLATILFFFTCSSACDFRSWRWEATHNSKLAGHVIETKMATSLLSCLSLCGLVSGCRTVNHRIQDGACELNEADDRWDDALILVDDPDFAYYRREIPYGLENVDSAHANELCHQDHILLDNTCLQLVPNDFLTFDDATIVCRNQYGRLAELDTPALEGILNLMDSFGQQSKYYIGMIRRSDGELVWRVSNTTVTTNRPPWRDDQPDNYPDGIGPEDCGSIEANEVYAGYEFRFNDVPCELLDRGYICQYDLWVHLAW